MFRCPAALASLHASQLILEDQSHHLQIDDPIYKVKAQARMDIELWWYFQLYIVIFLKTLDNNFTNVIYVPESIWI